MRKVITLVVMLAVAATTLQGQVLKKQEVTIRRETLPELQRKMTKSDDEVGNAKKAAKVEVWLNRAGLFYKMGVLPFSALYVGQTEEEVVKEMGQPTSAEMDNRKKVEYKKYVYPDVDVFFQSGKVAMWLVKKYPIEGAFDKAYDCLEKASKLTPTVEQSKDIATNVTYIVNVMQRDAANNYKAGNNQEASTGFYKVYQFGKNPFLNRTDTTILYYAGLSAMEAKNYESAKKYLQECLDLGYEAGGDIYNYLVLCLNALDQNESSVEILTKAVEKYPSNIDLIQALITMSSKLNKDPEEVIGYIRKAQVADPKNPNLYVQEGIAYNRLKQYDKAEVAYQKALEINQNVFAPLYNLGYMYYTQGNHLAEELNAMDINDTKGQLAKKAECVKAREKAVLYLKKAFDLDNNSEDALTLLKELCFTLSGEEGINAEQYRTGYEYYNKIYKERYE